MRETSERYKLIEKYVKNTHDDATNDPYLETERFAGAGVSKFHNRQLLWHGSRLTNYVGILSQGVFTAPPEAPAAGYTFDKGAYFAV
ncbi:Poly [ADP-ribose] polymerase 1 [Modicella reniformis]|uniref:Poly [ADP-ribose] polymerase n=1 Tax=Modicella reniformis TaxID=1440133 RepID=A0A9P6J552_9FUNG|nr:Poly [ADP-ribose] polymerase 1 [Modicella reniformis]